MVVDLWALIPALVLAPSPQLTDSGGSVFVSIVSIRYRCGPVEVDFRRAEVVRDGKPVVLSAREFQLLHYLIDHQGDTLSREELLTEVWKYDAMPSTRTVDVHVAWLRQKLEDNPKVPQLILTIRGLGYKFTG